MWQIRIHISRREPAAKLVGDDAGKLLVAMFAWDSNAYVGNEYWIGMLEASGMLRRATAVRVDVTCAGDPAAACSSLVPELLNPDCNEAICGSSTFLFDD